MEKLNKKCNIYVAKGVKEIARSRSISHSSAARSLLSAVFKHDAIINCSIMGKPAKAPQGKPGETRPGLFRPGLDAVLSELLYSFA